MKEQEGNNFGWHCIGTDKANALNQT